jgi:mannitol-1-phosphate/altronate dehydrogenase
MLTAALAGVEAFTVMSCDNMRDGDTARTTVVG